MNNKLYWTFRTAYFNKGEWRYTPEQIVWSQFDDYEWIISMNNSIIPEDRYTKINENWKKNKTMFLEYGYVDWMDKTILLEDIKDTASFNNIKMFSTSDEAVSWVDEKN